MVRDDLYITVPTYFRCPISLEVMTSPVSLCTGVTYDRTSIQRWLDAGNNTCPATMQLLHTKELIPNHTLQRLINIWSDSLLTRSPNSLARQHAAQLLHHLHADLRQLDKHFLQYPSLIAQNLSVLTSFAAESEANGVFLLEEAGGRVLPVLVSVVGKVKDLSFLEKIVLFCNVLLRSFGKRDSDALRLRIEMEKIDFRLSILMGLKQGRLELRIAVAKFLELLAKNMLIDINSCSIFEDDEFHPALLRLMNNPDPEAADASLTLLIRSVQLKRNKTKIVRAGGVKVLAAALAEAELNTASTEKALMLLEMVVGTKEGRNAICADENCVRAVVKKVLKVSSAATEHAVAVLWSLCCLFGEKREAAAAAAAAMENNGMAKILVVLQSDCSPAVRRMCGDLLRVCRCSSKRSCVSWYDTKTTHIMPF